MESRAASQGLASALADCVVWSMDSPLGLGSLSVEWGLPHFPHGLAVGVGVGGEKGCEGTGAQASVPTRVRAALSVTPLSEGPCQFLACGRYTFNIC